MVRLTNTNGNVNLESVLPIEDRIVEKINANENNVKNWLADMHAQHIIEKEDMCGDTCRVSGQAFSKIGVSVTNGEIEQKIRELKELHVDFLKYVEGLAVEADEETTANDAEATAETEHVAILVPVLFVQL